MSDYCPRGAGPDSPYVAPLNGEMKWRDDGTCSYCGSLSPERFFEAVEAGCEVIPTDKVYKVYVRSTLMGQAKFYMQHLDTAGQDRFIELVNSKRMHIGYPGHFYVLPFFCKPA